MGLHSPILFWVCVFFFCCFWAGGGFRCVGTWMVEKMTDVAKSLKTLKDEASSRANALKDKLPGDNKSEEEGRNVLVELAELRVLVLQNQGSISDNQRRNYGQFQQLQADIQDIQGAISTNSEVCGNDNVALHNILDHLKIDGNGNPVDEE